MTVDMTLIVIVSFVVETLTNLVKVVYDPEKRMVNVDVLAAGVVGILVALAFDFDVFRLLGVHTALPYLGHVITGLLFTRGANVLHDLIALIGGPNK